MIQYPLVQINRELWNKKVVSTNMYSVPAEDQALPHLVTILDLLRHLETHTLAQTLPAQHIQYFLTQVFPPVCQKILKSRYFRNKEVLNLSNQILEQCAHLVINNLALAEQYPLFAQMLITVLNADELYYKENNQFVNYKTFADSLNRQGDKIWVQQLKEGDKLDVLKFSHMSAKGVWSRGKVLEFLKPNKVKIEFQKDEYDETTIIQKNSYMIAPYKSKSTDFEWRMELKQGDLIDCQDHYGGWYNSTIIQIIHKNDQKKLLKVAFKVYCQDGNKFDQKGCYYGLTNYTEDVDATSPKIQPFKSIVKQRSHFDSGSKSRTQNDDLNDSEFEEISGQKLYALPRKKYLSQFLFVVLNQFGRKGGFSKPVQLFQNHINIVFLSTYVKAISGVAPILHKTVVKELVQRLKPVIEKHIFIQNQQFVKQFTKERSQMLFSGFKTLQKRIYSMEKVYQYENEKKMRLVDSCLQSEALKRKLQGLNELKDIIKSLTYSSQRNKTIKKWIADEKIFEKIYLTNSHVQLIKKSQDFFRFLINQSILQVTDLERLYKIAQKGDYQSRISLYKLFQQVSHIFKKPHVDFLIDTILESDLSVVLNQDIDLLNEMSKFSNYFPKDKVRTFFQSIILGQNQHQALYDYATKKYCEVVAKGYEMKSCRADIIHSFINKLTTHNIKQVSRVLKGIFQAIGVGQYGKKDLNQILAQENIDEVVISALINHKNDHNIVNQVLSLLGFIYKLSYKVKIYIKTLRAIWNEMRDRIQDRKQYFKWVNQFIGCQQGLGQYDQLNEFQSFFQQMFPKQQLKNLTVEQYNLMKSLMIEINKKCHYIASVYGYKEAQYRRRVNMDELKLYKYFLYLIYEVDSQQVYQKALSFFVQMYNGKNNQLEYTNKLLQHAMRLMEQYSQTQQWIQVGKTLKLINVLIDNSQKKCHLQLDSLQKRQKSQNITLIILNDIVYVTDSSKKKQISVALNATLYQLKKFMTTLYSISIQQIKLTQDKEIPQYYNSRIMKDIPINLDQPITISKRYISTHNEPQILFNNKLHPKVVRCFTILFERYSQNGLMSKQNCQDFTSACLGTINRRYDDKIHAIFTRYDYDNDGKLTLQGFLAFYQDSAKDPHKSGTVWANLKSFGIDYSLKFADQEEEISSQILPRQQLSNNPDFYQQLFSFLHHQEIAPMAFQLLRRLPISQKIYKEVLGIGKEGQLNVSSMFSFEDYYSFYYKLNIIACLSQSQSQMEKQWLSRFTAASGMQFLFEKLKQFMAGYEQGAPFEAISVQLINCNIKIIYNYFVGCFVDQNRAKAVTLLNYDIDIDDKIQFLVAGAFPKTQHKIPQMPIERIFQWRGENQIQICNLFIDFLSKIWLAWGQRIQKDHSRFSAFNKVLSIICLLQINQNPTKLVQTFKVFFPKPPSNAILRQFYCLILTQCFYSEEGQDIYISELFKHIALTNIISDYFRILAVLVSKFGMHEEQVSQMPEILLNNILHQKNQLTIQGCAKLLSNFHLGTTVAQTQVELLWDKCLFGRQTPCKKQATRQAIYDLILKVCQNNKEITDNIINRTRQTLQTRIKEMKITYSNQVNQRSTTGYAGIKNLGNICYMISMLQQLYINKTFRYLLMRIDDNKQPEWVMDQKERMIDDNFLHQIQRIFGYLDQTSRVDFVPYAFCQAYKPFGQAVNVMIQQDVQEFVFMFFDKLEASIKDHPLRRLVDNFYKGASTNLFECHECKQTKKVQDPFYCLSLQVKNSKSLGESFNRFILGELINDYKCDFCGKKADVSKKTRVSKAPHILIFHLQRIVFNLDTFMNQKITTKHQFPLNFNLYPYTLEYYQNQQNKTSQKTQQNDKDKPQQHDKAKDYQYEISGIICHRGNAETGHYISYIKNQQGKWFEFNDSQVSSFNPSNIETQCFGGTFNYDDQYDWQRKENSKSAYLLIYRKMTPNKIQMEVDSQQNISQLLATLGLSSEETVPQEEVKKEQEPMETQLDSSQPVEDSEESRELRLQKELEEIAIIKKNKSEDGIDVDSSEKKPQNPTEKPSEQPKQASNKLVVRIKDQVSAFLTSNLKTEIDADNETHFFQKCLASTSFSKFFAKLLILPQSNSQQMVKLCQKLTFGFWLKSPSFKELLYSLSLYIKEYPQALKPILAGNVNLATLLIQNSQSQVRTQVATFLVNSFYYFIQERDLTLLSEDINEDNQLVVTYLDNLFTLIPTTVSRCWTKFSQYFQFWYDLSRRSPVCAGYMVRKQVLKHFIDYFLEKKSPLKIYIDKPQIGSTYATPNFTMLLKTIQSLLQFYAHNQIALSDDQKLIIINFNFIQKLIHDKYENIAIKIVRLICPNNLIASQKIAIVLVKGLHKANYDNVQYYLDVLHQFVLIEDSHQSLRVLWVIGRQSLMLSTISKMLSAMNGYSLDDRIYEFPSALHIQGSSSLLEPLYTLVKKMENMCMLCLQQLLKLCDQSQYVRNYVWGLGPPSYLYARYVDFFGQFINSYLQDAKRLYGSTVFNKQEVGTNVKKLYNSVLTKLTDGKPHIYVYFEPSDLEKRPETNKYETDQIRVGKQIKPIIVEFDYSQEIVRSQSQDNWSSQNDYTPSFDDNINGIGMLRTNSTPHKNASEQNKPSENTENKASNPSQSDKTEEIAKDLSKRISNQAPKETRSMVDSNPSESQTNLANYQLNYQYISSDYMNILQQQWMEKQFSAESDQQRIKINIEKMPSRNQDQQKPHQYVSEQQENLLDDGSSKNQKNQEKAGEKAEIQEVRHDSGLKCYHPAKFIYKYVQDIKSQMPNVRIQRHFSDILQIRTYPNGNTNKIFTSTHSYQKLSDRLQPNAWEDTNTVSISGFFITNNTKQALRIQTEQGSYHVRSLDSVWIWSKEILRMWVPERFMEWPEWSLYSEEGTEPQFDAKTKQKEVQDQAWID